MPKTPEKLKKKTKRARERDLEQLRKKMLWTSTHLDVEKIEEYNRAMNAPDPDDELAKGARIRMVN